MLFSNNPNPNSCNFNDWKNQVVVWTATLADPLIFEIDCIFAFLHVHVQCSNEHQCSLDLNTY